MTEKITTTAEWSEATKFLADLADGAQDGLGESAKITPEEIVRDASGRLLEVIATIDDGDRMIRKRFVAAPAPVFYYAAALTNGSVEFSEVAATATTSEYAQGGISPRAS